MAHPDPVRLQALEGERPAGITCPRYARGEGKRCLHYVPSGRCNLPELEVCSEWLKHNGGSLPTTETLSGTLASRPARPRPAPMPVELSAEATAPVDVDQLRGFTTEDIESFKALGVEVRMFSEAHGEFWLVPAYTDKPRFEITPEHAATVMRVLSLFPGAQLTGFEKKTPHQERPERPETRS